MAKLNRNQIIVGRCDIQRQADYEDRELTDEEFEELNEMVKREFGIDLDLDPGEKE